MYVAVQKCLGSILRISISFFFLDYPALEYTLRMYSYRYSNVVLVDRSILNPKDSSSVRPHRSKQSRSASFEYQAAESPSFSFSIIDHNFLESSI